MLEVRFGLVESGVLYVIDEIDSWDKDSKDEWLII